jgi:hypothetical protein
MLLHLGNQIHLLLRAPRTVTVPLCLASFARNLAVSIQPPLFSWHRATIAKDKRRETSKRRERLRVWTAAFDKRGNPLKRRWPTIKKRKRCTDKEEGKSDLELVAKEKEKEGEGEEGLDNDDDDCAWQEAASKVGDDDVKGYLLAKAAEVEYVQNQDGREEEAREEEYIRGIAHDEVDWDAAEK